MFHTGVALIPLTWLAADLPSGDSGLAGGGGGGPVAVSLVSFPTVPSPDAPLITAEAPPPAADPIPVPQEPAALAPPAAVPDPSLPFDMGPSPGDGINTETGEGPGEEDDGPDLGDSGAGAGEGEGSGARVYVPPRLLAGALPLNPEESQDLDLPQEIPVRLRIGPDGSVVEILPDDPDLPEVLRRALDRSALAMRFVPARLGGEPVEAWFSMTFIYRK